MHDIDRTLSDSEYEAEMDAYEADYDGEYEYEFEGEEEYEDEYEGPYYEGEGVFAETEEMELASELLSVSDDAELEYFLGKLIKRAGRKIRRFVKSKTGRALGKALKGVAKKVLPIAGGAVGTVFGGPASGAIGSKLAAAGGRAFGLELEGLSPEDQQLEVAKRVVRMAGDAAKNAAVQPSTGNPLVDAKKAVVKAAKKQAPGLVRPGRSSLPMAGGVPGRTGRWIRRGRKIVLMGV